MGQQQLLLIILSVIIVGIAIAVGINMFQTSAVDSNRQALISDVTNLGSKAHRYFRTPTSLAGGGQDFNGFSLSLVEAQDANGMFTCTATEPTAISTKPTSAAASSISASADSIYIVAWGNEIGNDNTNYVQIYATVSGRAVTTTILN